MKLNCLPLAALVAISSAVDTTVVNNGVKYEILGALIQVRPTLEAAPHRFDKEHLAHFIERNGGVKNGAKKKCPEELSTGNGSEIPPLQNGCNIADRNVFSSPIVFNGKDSFAWLDPEAGENSHKREFRIIYRKEAGRDAMTYCATVEHQGTIDYVGCPS